VPALWRHFPLPPLSARAPLTPNPAPLTHTPTQVQQQQDAATVLAARRRVYGPNAALSYAQPLHIVRGAGARLFDERGTAYLDCVNNVAHVGHSNEAVRSMAC
jgi:ethanolamine-phosphate phospho-lyase